MTLDAATEALIDHIANTAASPGATDRIVAACVCRQLAINGQGREASALCRICRQTLPATNHAETERALWSALEAACREESAR
ncbi:MAG: hypothetical protein HRU13_09065 [Phycisphaerales bacterium]|nr:hypothetical protein [Phycisphaerales bacterium]